MFQNADIRFTVLMRESSEATGRHRPTAVRLQGSERLIAGALSVAAKTVVQLESELELRRHQLSEVLVVSLLAPAVTPIFRVAVCDTICEALGEAPWRGFPEKDEMLYVKSKRPTQRLVEELINFGCGSAILAKSKLC